MKMSEILNANKPKQDKAKLYRRALIITGILSIIFIFITVYAQHAGVFTINMTHDLADKGIILSESLSFEEESDTLSVEAIDNALDILGSSIKLAEVEATDGQYYDEHFDYVAYTFYIKNTGLETINLSYNLQVLEEYKNVGDATIVRIIQSQYVEGNTFINRIDNQYMKEDNNKSFASDTVEIFQPGEIRKFTLLMWFDGRYTTPDMIGGAIKFNFTFGIVNAEVVVWKSSTHH